MSAKKYLVVIILIFVVILGPVFLFSNWGLGVVQYFVDKNPEGSAAPWFQYTLGKIYYLSMRPEKSVDALKLYVDRYDKNRDQRYWNARYFMGLSLEECERPREAANLFREYLEQCPREDVNRPEVKKEALRLRSYIPDYPIPD